MKPSFELQIKGAYPIEGNWLKYAISFHFLSIFLLYLYTTLLLFLFFFLSLSFYLIFNITLNKAILFICPVYGQSKL